ncbi:MAG: ribosomal protein [Bacteroidota bacterium]|jgi:small subunit ribosomal protein S14
MAKKSMLERERKRKKLAARFAQKRETILKELRKATSLEKIFELNEKIQKLPRNSSRIRIKNRCWKTGRPRGYFRFFGLCRNAVREMAHDCLLPGVTKASW